MTCSYPIFNFFFGIAHPQFYEKTHEPHNLKKQTKRRKRISRKRQLQCPCYVQTLLWIRENNGYQSFFMKTIWETMDICKNKVARFRTTNQLRRPKFAYKSLIKTRAARWSSNFRSNTRSLIPAFVFEVLRVITAWLDFFLFVGEIIQD